MASDLEGGTTVGCTDAVLAFTEGKDSPDAMDDPGRHTSGVIMGVGTTHIRVCNSRLPPGVSPYGHHFSQRNIRGENRRYDVILSSCGRCPRRSAIRTRLQIDIGQTYMVA